MTDSERLPPIVTRDVWKVFKRKTGERVKAVTGVSLEVPEGTLTALVGPDAGGKTTLLRMIAGLIAPTYGSISVLGIDVAVDPQAVQERIGYMPQKFGLYEDLSVQENLDLYADVHGVDLEAREALYERLMKMTALGPFRNRLAGRLSGGMKQKLGLACTLIQSPPLLVLDEPTVGVDPLSRRELWAILLRLVRADKLTVLLSTSYLDEAERCDHTIVMRGGTVIGAGTPADIAAFAKGKTFVATPSPWQNARALQSQLIERPGVVDAVPSGGLVRFVTASVHAVPSVTPRFEDGFMVLLHEGDEDEARPAPSRKADEAALPRAASIESATPAVEVEQLVRKFGAFTAVDRLSFTVRRGEVFGLLGANGAGKTTTFRMLCGLLPATSGTLRVAGTDLRKARAAARERLGYMAQKFSLYGMLNVRENLEFFGRTYGLRRRVLRERVDWAVHEFELEPFLGLAAGELPGGFKRRLALAAALLHEPEMLFLDEPTSGADPVARREFWVRINALAERGVSIVVTTHFMEEAEYCDRILIIESGRALAEGTPAEIRAYAKPEPGREPVMEDAFIAIVEAARGPEAGAAVAAG